MGIFKENLDAKEEQLKYNLVLPTQINDAQTTKIGELNKQLLHEKQQDNILTVTGLEQIKADQFEEKLTAKYKVAQREKDPHASDREIRRRAEKKTSTALNSGP